MLQRFMIILAINSNCIGMTTQPDGYWHGFVLGNHLITSNKLVATNNRTKYNLIGIIENDGYNFGFINAQNNEYIFVKKEQSDMYISLKKVFSPNALEIPSTITNIINLKDEDTERLKMKIGKQIDIDKDSIIKFISIVLDFFSLTTLAVLFYINTFTVEQRFEYLKNLSIFFLTTTYTENGDKLVNLIKYFQGINDDSYVSRISGDIYNYLNVFFEFIKKYSNGNQIIIQHLITLSEESIQTQINPLKTSLDTFYKILTRISTEHPFTNSDYSISENEKLLIKINTDLKRKNHDLKSANSRKPKLENKIKDIIKKDKDIIKKAKQKNPKDLLKNEKEALEIENSYNTLIDQINEYSNEIKKLEQQNDTINNNLIKKPKVEISLPNDFYTRNFITENEDKDKSFEKGSVVGKGNVYFFFKEFSTINIEDINNYEKIGTHTTADTINNKLIYTIEFDNNPYYFDNITIQKNGYQTKLKVIIIAIAESDVSIILNNSKIDKQKFHDFIKNEKGKYKYHFVNKIKILQKTKGGDPEEGEGEGEEDQIQTGGGTFFSIKPPRKNVTLKSFKDHKRTESLI